MPRKLNYFFHSKSLSLESNEPSYNLHQLVNLNDQLDDMSSLTKLASLVSIQQTFPNDDLKLFDQTVTPTKFHQATPQSASSLTQTVKSVKTGLSKLNLISNNTTTPVSINGRSNSIFSTLKVTFSSIALSHILKYIAFLIRKFFTFF